MLIVAARVLWGIMLLLGISAVLCAAGCDRHISKASASGGDPSASAEPQPGDPADPNSPILGKWVHVDGDITTTYEFRADGTCSRSLAVANGSESVSGKWMIDGNGVLRIALCDGNLQGAAQPHQIRVDSQNLNFIEDGSSGQFIRPH